MFLSILSQENQFKSNKILRFDIESFFITILRFSRKWDYKANFEFSSQIKKNLR